jgi:hypothetical protein
MRYLALAALVFLAPSAAFAQSTGFGHGRVGVSVFPLAASSDDEARIQTPRVDRLSSDSVWLVAGNVSLTRHVGVGFETATLGTLAGNFSTLCCGKTELQKERVAFLTARAGAPIVRRIALEGVIGVGELHQRYEGTSELRSAPSSRTSFEDERRARAYAFGVDVPMRIVRYVTVTPFLRVYSLRRGTQTGAIAFQPSRRTLVGVTADFAW